MNNGMSAAYVAGSARRFSQKAVARVRKHRAAKEAQQAPDQPARRTNGA
jgi:hypothetical protein